MKRLKRRATTKRFEHSSCYLSETRSSMKNLGENKEKKSASKERKVIKFKQKTFKELETDTELYTLEESVDRRFDKTRLLRESTLEYNGFSADVMDQFPEKAKDILTIAREGIYNDKRLTLNEIADMFEESSVDYIKGSNHWQDDWQNIVAAYINTGDWSQNTILYDTITEEFHVMSVNDFILSKDQEYRIVGSEPI